MLSTPLISCSIGEAMVSARTSAEAPGYVAVTCMVGGTISGYSVIGSARYEIAPIRLRMTEIPPAKIGRSIKKGENPMDASRNPAPRPSADGRLNASALRPDLLAGSGTGEALDDYGVAAFHTCPDYAQAVHHRPELDAFDAHHAV